MGSNILVSVIITTCNRKWDVLERAMDSVLNQSFSYFELIVINDCPENKRLKKEIGIKIKQKNYAQIRYFCLERNRGACIARNIGIKMARGQYVAFLDDDDEWLPQKLEIQYHLICHNKKIGMVYGSYYHISNNGRRRIERQINVTENPHYKLLGWNVVGSTSFPLIRKECFYTCGAFNPRLKSCQDWDVWLRITQKYQVAFCKEPLGLYHLGTDCISSSMNKRIQGWKMILHLYEKEYKKNPEQLVKFLETIVSECAGTKNIKDLIFFCLKLEIVRIRYHLINQ